MAQPRPRPLALALAVVLQPCGAPGPPGPAIWRDPTRQIQPKRCDMLTQVFKGPNGPPGYVEGKWVPSHERRRGATERAAMECIDSTMPCPRGGCDERADEPLSHASTQPASPDASICATYYQRCFGDRRSAAFDANLRGLAYVWEPSDGCHFSPIATAGRAAYDEWARSLEAAAGPMLWVGDETLAEHFVAFQALTGGARRSQFHPSTTLVNTYSLAPMTPKQLRACDATDAAIKRGEATAAAYATLEPPCPPRSKDDMSNYYWEVRDGRRPHTLYIFTPPRPSRSKDDMSNYYWEVRACRGAAHTPYILYTLPCPSPPVACIYRTGPPTRHTGPLAPYDLQPALDGGARARRRRRRPELTSAAGRRRAAVGHACA